MNNPASLHGSSNHAAIRGGTRLRRFGWTSFMFALCVAAFGGEPAANPKASINPKARVPKGKIEWTRLVTHSQYWNRHAQYDAALLAFIRGYTPLDVAPKWRETEPKNLADLCRYPFIYAHDVTSLTKPEAANLAEFIKRGGFLLIDFCCNDEINPPPLEFLANQLRTLKPHLPGLTIAELTKDHEIFSVYFRMKHFPPQVRPGNSRWTDHGTNPMHGLFIDNRMVGVVGLSGFQCSWSGIGDDSTAIECMKMVSNIHIYAMTQ